MSPRGGYLDIAGTRLFAYDIGERKAPALIYLHGGPGMGCHEFVRWQAEALGRHGLRVIAFDQRGTHHSDPVPDAQELSEEILVEDCEALREQLGIDRAFILGHSYGGRIALRYAVRFPERVRGVLFENPAWDFESTERHRLPAIAEIYESHGRPDLARRCIELAEKADMFANGYRADLLAGVAVFGEAWFLYDRSAGALVDQAGLDPVDRQASLKTAFRLIKHPDLLEDLTSRLADLTSPACLIVGEADLVTAPSQIEAFARAFGPDRITRVEKAGHYVQAEQQDAYTRLVAEFVSEA